MYCAKNPETLIDFAYNSISKNPSVLDNFVKDLDKLVKEFNKAHKSYTYWTKQFKPFSSPSDNKQEFANAVAKSENGANSLYKETMTKAKAQFEALSKGIEKYLSENGDEKLTNKILKKIETRKQRFTE